MRFEFGEFVIDSDARQLWRGGQPLHLSPKAFDLLQFLVAERPRAVAKETLYDHLWPDTYVMEANLPILIREIRTALGDDERAIIRTVQRHGYAFAADPGPPIRAETSPHVLMQGEHAVPLAEGENVVGREPSAAVRIASTSVSRRHAIITVDGDRATVADLQSKNGTKVNGVAAVGPRTLTDGDVIAFGTIFMVYRWCPGDSRTETIL